MDATGTLDEAIADVERHFTHLVRRTRARWKQLAQSVHPDLQPIGWRILAALVDAGAVLPAKQLGEQLAIDKSVLSRQLTQLEELGLIERRVDEQDGRARLLIATPHAVERLTATRASHLDQLRRDLAGWRVEDLRTLADMLGRLSELV